MLNSGPKIRSGDGKNGQDAFLRNGFIKMRGEQIGEASKTSSDQKKGG
jgi:hypothetical protein